MSTTLLVSLVMILLLTAHGIDSNGQYLLQLDRTAYDGDLGRVIKLVELQLNWNKLYIDIKSSLTAIHHALRGRHDILANQSLQLHGNHEVAYL